MLLQEQNPVMGDNKLSTACHITKQQNWTSFEIQQVKLISQNN